MPAADGAAFSFAGIGTQWEITAPRPLSGPLQAELLQTVAAFDGEWSRFRDDSRVAAMAREAGSYTFPAEATALGELYRTLYRLTGGAMTPLIGSSLERLGYDAEYSLRPTGPAVPAPAWDGRLEWNGTTLTASGPVVLDIGAAGKGLLVDLLADRLAAAGHNDFLVDGSGDLLARGPGTVRVGLEHPYDPGQAIGVVELSGRSLCASAANRRAWGDGLHHVLDGTTGLPVRTAVATWAMAETAMVADALATALFFVPGQALEESFEFSWLTVFSDGSATHSADFEGKLFT